MNKLILLTLVSLSFLNAMAQQDAEGFTDVTHNLRSGYILRVIQTPRKIINNKSIVEDKNSGIALSYYNELTSTVLKSGNRVDTYKICFSIEDSNNSFHIAENGRLLIKLGKGQIVTLNAWRDFDADNLINGKYHVNAEYKVKTKQLNAIIKKNVSKLRIEKIMGEYIDIEPDIDISEITKGFQAGLYDRLKKHQDSFTSGF